MKEYKIQLIVPKKKYECIIVTVAHKEFIKMSSKTIISFFLKPSLLIDVKDIWTSKKLPNFITKWSF